MEAFFLLVVAVNAVLGIPTSIGDGGQSGMGGDFEGEVYRPISVSGGGNSGSTSSAGNPSADERFIADILSQVDHSDGLPTDLISSIISGGNNNDDDDDDSDLMAQLYRFTHGDDDDKYDESDNTFGGRSETLTESYGDHDQTDSDDTTTDNASSSEEPSQDIISFVLGQLGLARKIFENAKSQISASEIARNTDVNPTTAISASTKLAASSVITSAKARARSSILAVRNAYLATIDQVKRAVSLMKALEKRFHVFAVAFSKSRNLAGNALLALKNIGGSESEEDDDDDYKSYPRGFSSSSSIGRSGSSAGKKKEEFLSALASAKSKVAAMKKVERSFLAVTRALASGRAIAYTTVRKARKGAIGLAKAMTMSDASVKSAIQTATSILSQAISTARATAVAKAEVSSILAEKARAQAQLAIQLAANALAAAKDYSDDDDEGSSEDDGDATAEPTPGIKSTEYQSPQTTY